MAQLVKNPPAMWETWVHSLGWKDPLEKGVAAHSSILVWRIPWTVQFMGSQSWTWLSDFHEVKRQSHWHQTDRDWKLKILSVDETVEKEEVILCTYRRCVQPVCYIACSCAKWYSVLLSCAGLWMPRYDGHPRRNQTGNTDWLKVC